MGKTLREVDLRARTGAEMIAIVRREEALTNPAAHEALNAGGTAGRQVSRGGAGAMGL